MPHLDLKYSSDLPIDSEQLFEELEIVFNSLDSSAGKCMGRAYPAISYRHSHAVLEVGLLNKLHRDDTFSNKLVSTLKTVLEKNIKQRCILSIELKYVSDFYYTNSSDI